MYGEYEERWGDVPEQAERAARRTAERAKRFARRASRHVRDADWDSVECEIHKVVEKAMSELEAALAAMRQEWMKRHEPSPSSGGKQSPKAQRVPIEYDKAEVPLDENTADSAPSASSRGAAPSSPLSHDGRDAERRVILEGLRTGIISVEEAEHRLNSLD